MASGAFLFALAIVISAACTSFSSSAAEVTQRPKIRIAFIGDSTADGLWGGVSTFVAKNKCLRGVLDLGRFGKNSTGLTRPDKYNWPKEARRIVEAYRPNLVIVSLGLNDRQPVLEFDEAGRRRVTQYQTPQWADRYKAQVNTLLGAANATKAPLLWLGLAAMRDKAINIDAHQKNEIFASAITEFGVNAVRFVEPWRHNSNGEDVFVSYIADKDGKMLNIRAGDGEHFTAAGDEQVAAYLFPKIVESLRLSGIEINSSCQLASE